MIIWIILNTLLIHTGVGWDIYPFILLNLCFSTQAAYAAPLILLAQTRQADRDKVHIEAAAYHNQEESDLLKNLIEDNTRLTARVATLTEEIHKRVNP